MLGVTTKEQQERDLCGDGIVLYLNWRVVIEIYTWDNMALKRTVHLYTVQKSGFQFDT